MTARDRHEIGQGEGERGRRKGAVGWNQSLAAVVHGYCVSVCAGTHGRSCEGGQRHFSNQ